MNLRFFIAALFCMSFVAAACPSVEELATQSSHCKAQGGWVSNKTNASGCVNIICDTHGIKKITCTKITDINQCVLVACDDEYAYNSCTEEARLREQYAPQGFWAKFKALFRK